MGDELKPRSDSTRIRHFFGGLLAVVGGLDVVEALIAQHPVRAQVLDAILPASVTLTGRTGTVIAGLSLLLLAGGVGRGKRIAWQLTLVALAASVALHLVKDLDLEEALLAGWVVAGLWWMRPHFQVASDAGVVARGTAVLALGLFLVMLYGLVGIWVLRDQLTPGFEMPRALQHVVYALLQETGRYDALTDRAAWFLQSLPWIAYGLVIVGLLILLRPAVAPAAGRADRQKLHELALRWGDNSISHLAQYGPDSQFWLDGEACVAYSVRSSTAIALGDPICPPEVRGRALREFIKFCDDHGWTCAFYQVAEPSIYREMGFRLVTIGSEALVSTASFSLAGGRRAGVRHAVARCRREGVTFRFMPGPDALDEVAEEMAQLSGRWLHAGKGREMSFGLGTLATLHDSDITAGLAFDAHGDLLAFVSWLPVLRRQAWTLDLMRRRPGAVPGVMEALIAASIEEAKTIGIGELSLGLAPVTVNALSPLPWFRRATSLKHFKAKFATSWEVRHLAVPATAALPEVLVALLRVHLPPMSLQAIRLRLPRWSGGRRRLAGT